MSVRTKNFLVCILSLLIGGMVYILFRPTAIISAMIGNDRWLTQLRFWMEPISNGFVRNYIGDFLWMVALCCGLYGILLPKPGEKLHYIFGAGLLGVIWELLQWLGAVKGTGDWLDVFMYGLAAFASFIINRKEKEV